MGRLIPIFVMMLLLILVGAAAAQEGGDPQRGGELYNQYCSMCHGTDGLGRVGANLSTFPGIRAGAAIVETTSNGVPGSVMPAWGQARGGPLSVEDIEDLAAYILGILGGTQPVQPAPTFLPPEIPPLPDVEGDPENGAVLFRADCQVCHGEQAQGGFGWPLAKSWPGVEPDIYLRQVIGEGIDGSVMPAWDEGRGGPYASDQIADVAAYVLSLEPVEGPEPPGPEPAGPLSLSVSLAIFGLLTLVSLIVLIRYYRRA
jgi:mono/diheme cytochrome c family protein